MQRSRPSRTQGKVTWDYLKGTLVNQAFLTAHVPLCTSNFSGNFFLRNRGAKIKARTEFSVKDGSAGLLAKEKLF